MKRKLSPLELVFCRTSQNWPELARTSQKHFRLRKWKYPSRSHPPLWHCPCNGEWLFLLRSGSFADSAHFVGELTATYVKKRKALPFFLLNSNIASVSAWSNDFNFEDYATRELSGYAKKNDVLIILSTSGGNYKKKQSINLIKLAKFAKKNKIFLISLLGKGGGEILKFSDISIVIKSTNTATIQEMHKIILHSICGYLDSRIK